MNNRYYITSYNIYYVKKVKIIMIKVDVFKSLNNLKSNKIFLFLRSFKHLIYLLTTILLLKNYYY